MKALVVSDVHGNLAALRAVLTDAPSFDAVWNLGDTVGYGPFPNECMDLLIDHGAAPFLLGNHDAAATGMLSIAGFNPNAALAAEWTRRQLTRRNRVYLQAQAPHARVASGILVHGSPRSPLLEYVLDSVTATANLREIEPAFALFGHTHVAAVWKRNHPDDPAACSTLQPGETLSLISPPLLLNPGSVGQPRDGDPRASYAIVDVATLTITGFRVHYDVAATQSAIRAVGLPETLASRLQWGR